jgi:hypothetical protein
MFVLVFLCTFAMTMIIALRPATPPYESVRRKDWGAADPIGNLTQLRLPVGKVIVAQTEGARCQTRVRLIFINVKRSFLTDENLRTNAS